MPLTRSHTMRRPRRSRYQSWSSCETMGSIPQSPTSLRPRSRDTGFPDSFCGVRNTSLPHPDARVGPDACITADDISVQKVLSRHRRSFMVKHKRTIAHGIITADMERMYSADLGMLHETETLDSADFGNHHNSRSSKDGADSLAPTEGSAAAEDELSSLITPTSLTKPTQLRKPQSDSPPQRRRSFLRRWMHK